MKHTFILAIAMFAATANAAEDKDLANISCYGKSEVTVSGRIDAIATKGQPPVHTDTPADVAVTTVPAAVPLAPPSMISDDALHGMPPTTTVGDLKGAGANAASAQGWDFKSGCVDYAEKFWAWRISKCKSIDATWVSPGEGKYLPGKEPKQ